MTPNQYVIREIADEAARTAKPSLARQKRPWTALVWIVLALDLIGFVVVVGLLWA